MVEQPAGRMRVRLVDRGVVDAVDWAEVPATVTWAVEGRVLLVSLAGAIDAGAHDRLETLLRTAGADYVRVLIDLAEVTFFGGVGVNFLARLAAAGATVQLVAVPERLQVRRALRAAGLGRIITS